ncbi:hypothetical protein LCGC14_2940360 [marine sediment metagenome]|uniref:Uncharacterized protein n=1 Tax=marine sediment metagenome TaxID=412755 RepID=A0A0F8XI62_9ZZZZ
MNSITNRELTNLNAPYISGNMIDNKYKIIDCINYSGTYFTYLVQILNGENKNWTKNLIVDVDGNY